MLRLYTYFNNDVFVFPIYIHNWNNYQLVMVLFVRNKKLKVREKWGVDVFIFLYTFL